MPPCSTQRSALAHGLELGCDLLEGAVGCGGGDPGDQPDQPVIAGLARRAVQQFRLHDALGGQPPHGAAQPLHRPGGLGGAVQDAHDVAPGLGGPHPPHGRQPRVQLGQDAGEVCDVAAGADLADGVRVAGAQAGIAADPPATRAARSPALVRSAISARSSWAIAPCGVVVSIGSRRLRKCAPLASSCGSVPCSSVDTRA